MAVLREVEKLMADTGMGKEAVITSLLVQAKTEEQPRLANMFRLACDKRGGSGGFDKKPRAGRAQTGGGE